MKNIFLFLFFTISSVQAQTVEIGNDLDLELLKEFNDFVKESPREIEALENYVAVSVPQELALKTEAIPKTLGKKTLLKKKVAVKKIIMRRLLDPKLQREMDLLNEKIDLVEQESKNQTIEEKRAVLSKPFQYETYKTIRKIPLNEIKAEDDILKQDDEIIEIKFTNLSDKEF